MNHNPAGFRESVPRPLPSTLSNQPPEVDFIDNRIHQCNQAFSVPGVVYDPDRGMYLAGSPMDGGDELSNAISPSPRPALPATAKMSFWAIVFPQAILCLQEQYPTEPKGRAESGYSIRDTSSWEQIQTRIQHAREAYENTTGLTGNFKKGMRKIVDNAPKLGGAVALIPDIDTISPVVSVLKALLKVRWIRSNYTVSTVAAKILTLKAAKQTIDIQKTVKDSLEDLDRHFDDIESYVAWFPNDQNILRASINMIASIFKAIEDVIGYYISNKLRKTFAIVFNGDEYRESLTRSLVSITDTSKALLHQAQNSDMWQNRQSFAKLSQLIRVESQKNAAYILNETKSLLEQHNINVRNLQFENEYLLRRVMYYDQKSQTEPLSPDSQASEHAQTILQHLYHNPDSSITDIEHIRNIEGLVPVVQKEQTEAIIRKPKFRDWVIAPYSKELLIHGDFEGTNHISALSLFCTIFIHGARDSDRFNIIAFFCGHHLEGEGVGGRKMIKSLITQLLQQQCFHIGELTRHVNFTLIDLGDLQELATLLRYLLMQIRGVTVICIIDGIKYYERDEYIEEMAVVLRFLLDLTLDENLSTVFKVLVTSPSPTHIVRDAFSPGDILPLDPASGVGQGFSTTRLVRDLHHQMLS